MGLETTAPVIGIERLRPDRIIRLDIEKAEVIAIEVGDVPGIPVFVRTCNACEVPDLSDWFMAPDRDLGTGWACRECGQEDDFRWTETTLSRMRG